MPSKNNKIHDSLKEVEQLFKIIANGMICMQESFFHIHKVEMKSI